MSIARKMRRSIENGKKASLYESRVFYPQGFKKYTIFISIITSFIVIVGIVLFITVFSDENNRKLDRFLVLGLFILIIYLEPIYFYLLTWKLRTSKISLTILDGKIILNGVIRIKMINISDVEIIKIANTKIEAILIKAKKNRDKESNSKIVIPVIWFGRENIKKFIQLIKNQELNKKIKFDL